MNDTNKFTLLKKEPTNSLKKQLNNAIRTINAVKNSLGFKQLIGHFQPGYIYGNPKIHKNIQNPPLRPIISQIGTPTYNVAKQINRIIMPYMNKKFMVESTYDVINILKTHNEYKILASLDVVNLFTNVPVHETIDLILQRVYHHENLAPPAHLSKEILKQLLITCTTKTPFKNIDGKLYYQKEGVSMGSPLGPVFANFFMSHLENEILPNLENKPKLYLRYVDDTLLLVDNIEQLHTIKNAFNEKSVLEFTSEIQKNNSLNFLDTTISFENGKYVTKIFSKPTATDDYINYLGICPDRYKTGVVKTLLHRAYHVSPTWSVFHQEITNIKQALMNNNFPISIIDKTINSFITNKLNPDTTSTKEIIKLFYKNQMSNNYKQEEKTLRRIIQTHVKPTHMNNEIKPEIFYKIKKLKNLVIKNNCHPRTNDAGVVYQFNCKEAGCSSSYIGYTTNILRDRINQHLYNGSIKDHMLAVHNEIVTHEIINNTKILSRKQTKQELLINEALLIKDIKPEINIQSQSFTNILKIF